MFTSVFNLAVQFNVFVKWHIKLSGLFNAHNLHVNEDWGYCLSHSSGIHFQNVLV